MCRGHPLLRMRSVSLTMEFYRRNYIEGLFLSSGILKSPDYTMELIYAATSQKLRQVVSLPGLYPCEGDSGGQ